MLTSKASMHTPSPTGLGNTEPTPFRKVDQALRAEPPGPAVEFPSAQRHASGPTIGFRGTLEQLAHTCSSLLPGSIVDLDGAVIVSSGDIAQGLLDDQLATDVRAPALSMVSATDAAGNVGSTDPLSDLPTALSAAVSVFEQTNRDGFEVMPSGPFPDLPCLFQNEPFKPSPSPASANTATSSPSRWSPSRSAGENKLVDMSLPQISEEAAPAQVEVALATREGQVSSLGLHSTDDPRFSEETAAPDVAAEAAAAATHVALGKGGNTSQAGGLSACGIAPKQAEASIAESVLAAVNGWLSIEDNSTVVPAPHPVAFKPMPVSGAFNSEEYNALFTSGPSAPPPGIPADPASSGHSMPSTPRNAHVDFEDVAVRPRAGRTMSVSSFADPAPTSADARAKLRSSSSFDALAVTDVLNPANLSGPLAAVAAAAAGEACSAGTTATAAPPIVIRAPGVTLRNGSLQVPDGATLMLGGTGLVLADVAVQGTATTLPDGRSMPLIYAGAAASGGITLRNVSVLGSAGHGIGVGTGALVAMERCEVAGNGSFGLVARGVGARVIATACAFRANTQDGVAVSRNAACTLDRCEVADNRAIGVCARASARVVATRTRIVNNASHGAAAQSGATADLTDCTIDGNEFGVLVMDSATASTLTRCTLSGNEHGVHVREAATATLEGCTIESSGKGAFAADSGSSLTLRESTVSGAREVAVAAHSAAHVTVEGGAVTRSGKHGIVVKHSRSTLTMRDARIVGCAAVGVYVSVMARADLTDCTLTSNKVAAIQATDTLTDVVATRCTLSLNGTIGAFINKGAKLTVVDCELAENASSGLEARDRSTAVEIVRCRVVENGRVGVYSHSAAAVALTGTRVSGNVACALLSGGRQGMDIGGGTISYDAECNVRGRTIARHLGRLCEDAGDHSGEL